MKTHKNNFPDFQKIKTFFQSFFKKTTFVLKKIISLQVTCKSSEFCYKILMLKSDKFQKKVTKKSLFRRNAGLLICNLGNYQNLNIGW